MNKNTRLLPHLNTCFLQKKAYDVHRKKIDYIRQSLKVSFNKNEYHNDSRSQDKLIHHHSSNRMSTIKEQASSRIQRISPWTKRQIEQCNVQNQRMVRKIQSCSSSFNHREMKDHLARSKQIMNRIRKFKVDPNTNRSELKSVHSLNLLQKIKHKADQQMTTRKGSLQNSRFKTQMSPQRKQSKQAKSVNSDYSGSLVNKKNSFDLLMNRRNNLKIKKHFGKDDFVSRAQARLSALKEHNSTELKKRKMTEPSPGQKRSRCFATQI